MKKILLGLFVLLCFAASAQDVKISQPYTFGARAWVHFNDSIRVKIAFQGVNDTLATQAYARGFAGGSLGQGFGIKVTGSTIAIDSLHYRKLDSLYAINDSTLAFQLNGAVYVFKYRGAVMSWNGRTGQVVPQDNDYAAFYAKLDSVYHDPAWINALNWSKIISTPTTFAGYGITNGVINAGGVYQWQADVFANRPPNPSNGTFFFGIDDSTVFYYNGARWITVAGGGIDSTVTYSYGLLKTTVGTNIIVKEDTTTLKHVYGSASPGVFQIFQKYGLLINGTDTVSLDTTIAARYTDTLNGRLATRTWTLSRGFLTAETDPVATAKTVNLSAAALTGILVGGTASQAVGSNPTYTFKADTTVLATLTALKDTAAILRALISTGGISQIYTKYGLIIRGTDTASVDTTLFLRFKDTTVTVATKSFVGSRGYLTTETDPVAAKDTIAVNQGPGILVTGLTKQALGNSPTWTFKVDSSLIATLFALGDTAAAIRAAFPTGYLTQVYTKYGLLKTGTDTLTVDTTLFVRFKDTTTKIASHIALADTAAVLRGLIPSALQTLTFGPGITGGSYNGGAPITAKADTSLLATILALHDTANVLRATPEQPLTFGNGLTGGSFNGLAPVTTTVDTSKIASHYALLDTAAILRAIIPGAFDSAHSQGGGFHTQAYYDQRYVPFTDTFVLNIVKTGQGVNLANGIGNTLVMKGIKDSGAVKQFIYPDSTVVNYAAFPPIVQMRDELKIMFTNNHVYEGNSITAGATLGSPSTQAYPVLINDTLGLTATTNRAVSNSTWMDGLSRQFVNDPAGDALWSYSIMLGENNFGEDTAAQKYYACREGLRTSIANHFMDSIWSVSGSGSGGTTITRTGTWSAVTSANFLSKSASKLSATAMKSSTLGDKITAVVYDNSIVVGTYAYKTGYGSVSITIDGNAAINPATGTNVWSGAGMASNFTSQIGTYDPRMPMVWVFNNLGIGPHTIVITLLQAVETDFDYIGKLMPPSKAYGMVAFHVTKRTPAGYFSYSDVGGGPAGIDSINRFYDTVVNTFRAWGLPVATAHSNEFLSNALFYTDGLHFLASGHVQLANAALTCAKRTTGSTATTDTATIAANGLESTADKYLLTHPIWEKNPSGLSSAYDTTGYTNLDTAFKKADSTGWGLGKNVSQKAIAHFIDTATFNIHTGGYNDARYSPSVWILTNGQTISQAHTNYNVGIGLNGAQAFVPLTLVGHAQFSDTNITVGSINKYELQINSIQNAALNGGFGAMTGISLSPNIQTGDSLNDWHGATILVGTQPGKLLNAYGINASGGSIGNVVNWFPFSAADVTVAGQAKIYQSALTAGNGKWAGFFGGGAAMYQAGALNLGLGDSLGHTSALLDMSSTTQGVLIPRMNTSQQNAMTPVNGLLIYNTDSTAFMFYAASLWIKLGGGSGGGIGGTYVTNITYPDSLTTVYVFNTGRTDTIRYKTYTGGGSNGLADPGSNGIVKRTALNTTAIAVAADFPTLNQNTTGSAGSLSAASALPNGTTAMTQPVNDNSTKVATTAYVNGMVASGRFLPVLSDPGGSGSDYTSATPDSATYTVVGNVVTFYGAISVTPTTGAAATHINFTIPISSTIAHGYDLHGTAIGFQSNTGFVIDASGSTSTHGGQFGFTSVNTSSHTFFYSVQYIID